MEKLQEGVRLALLRCTKQQRRRVGFELEGHAINGNNRVANIALETLRDTEIFKDEYGKFNWEYAPAPVEVAKLSGVEKDIRSAVSALQLILKGDHLKPVMTAILPNIRSSDLVPANIGGSSWASFFTENWQRYKEKRNTPIDICGFKPETIDAAAMMASFQINIELSIDPITAAYEWNLLHLILPPILGVCVGSPLLPDERIGVKESRIVAWNELFGKKTFGRVFYGPGWITDISEVFDYYLKYPELRKMMCDDQVQRLERHIRTLWPFIRLRVCENSLRAEVRVFSSMGLADLIPNLYLLVFSFLGLVKNRPSLPSFDEVMKGVSRVVYKGLKGVVAWDGNFKLDAQTVVNDELLPLAIAEAKEYGIRDLDKFEVIKARLERGMTPADALIEGLKSHGNRIDRADLLTERLAALSISNTPICDGLI